MKRRKRGRDPDEVRFRVPSYLRMLIAVMVAQTGESESAFLRRAAWRAVDRTIARTPGSFLWLRPGARVFEQVGAPDADGIVVVRTLAEAAGGERVWVLQRLEGLPATCNPDGLPDGVGFLCDLSPGEVEHAGLSVRGVLVSAADVLPRHPGRAGGAARRPKLLGDLGTKGPVRGVRHGS